MLFNRNRDFRYLWLSSATGFFGAAITIVALPIVALITLDASAAEVALLASTGSLPWLLLGLPAGAWVDRWPRRVTILISLAVRVVVLASVPLAFWWNGLTLFQLFVVAFVTGCAAVFFEIAYQAMVPSVVESGELVEANSVFMGTTTVADSAGRMGGGALVALIGGAPAMWGQVVTSVLSMLAISAVGRDPRSRTTASDHFLRQVLDGLRFTFSTPPLRATLYTAILWNAASGISGALYMTFLVREVGLGATAIGFVVSSMGIGAFLGSLLVRRVSELLGTARAWRGALLLGALCSFLVPLTTRGAGVAFILVGWLGIGIAVSFATVLVTSFRQGFTPAPMMGRVLATTRVLSWGVLPVSAAVAAWLTTLISVTQGMWVAALVFLACPLSAWLGPLRSVRDFDLVTRSL